MPNLNVDKFDIPGGSFSFSAIKPEHLKETRYTLVTIACDVSGSVARYKDLLEQALKDVVKACRHSPQKENLLIRVMLFNGLVTELHGFRPLADIDEDKEYSLGVGGGTALFDASYEAIIATTRYAEILSSQEFTANGIVFIITDGDDGSSTTTAKSVATVVSAALKNEEIDSLTTVLVGVDVDKDCTQYLSKFKNDAGFDAFIDIGDASAGKLAKLANFVSKSISSASKSLGTGASVPKDQLIF